MPCKTNKEMNTRFGFVSIAVDEFDDFRKFLRNREHFDK